MLLRQPVSKAPLRTVQRGFAVYMRPIETEKCIPVNLPQFYMIIRMLDITAGQSCSRGLFHSPAAVTFRIPLQRSGLRW